MADEQFPELLPYLSHDELIEFSKSKSAVYFQNELYLRAHPEIEQFIRQFMREVLRVKPHDIGKFAALHFAKKPAPMK